MDLDGIEVFVRVIQAGSFSRAAKVLGMPNSTVSAKVSQLEKRLGVTLIHRTTRNLRLTQAGESYFRACARGLDELQAAESELASAQSEPRGLLRLTAPVEIGHSVLPPMVRAYLERYPQMTVDLIVTNRVLDLVTEGVDLAIRAGKLKDSGLIGKRFALGQFALWAAPDYLERRQPLSHPRDLSQHQFLQFSLFKGRSLELTSGKENARVSVSGRLFADDFEVLKSLAILGEGIVFLPNLLCAEEAKQNKLARVLPDWHGGTVTFSLVYPSQRFVSPKVRAFIAVAEQLLRNQGL